MRKLDITGIRFTRLVAIEPTGINKARQTMWLCKCDCGKHTTVSLAHLRAEKVQSCGCLHLDRVTIHGMCKSKEWFAYQHAKARCKADYSKHEHYYDRGIRFNFTSFDEFFTEVGLKPSNKHSLDRIDNDGSYEAGNVKWSTKSEQERNRRCNNCVVLKQRIKELEAQIALMEKINGI
jgi:hypothetical protein